MRAWFCLLLVAIATQSPLPCSAVEREASHGKVRYEPSADESAVAERFRLAPHEFPYELRVIGALSEDLSLADLTFPSPVETDSAVNNTVHCEYYQPLINGAPRKNCPAVIVLHILGGDFAMTRVYSNMLAHHGVAALFLKMPYYGPRRDPTSSKRMISHDPRETVEGMTQAVLDIRRAAAWLRQREEIDPARVGISGISLGGITACLAAECEPRLSRICPILAGGDLGQVAVESPRFERTRRFWQSQGGDPNDLLSVLKPVDPLTYATNLKGRDILMINATDDEVIPKACTESLWRELGEPRIIWQNGGHYSVGRHFFKIMDDAVEFFESPMENPINR